MILGSFDSVLVTQCHESFWGKEGGSGTRMGQVENHMQCTIRGEPVQMSPEIRNGLPE